MAEVGQFVVLGLAQGITGAQGTAVGAMRNVASSLTSVANLAASGTAGGAGRAGQITNNYSTPTVNSTVHLNGANMSPYDAAREVTWHARGMMAGISRG